MMQTNLDASTSDAQLPEHTAGHASLVAEDGQEKIKRNDRAVLTPGRPYCAAEDGARAVREAFLIGGGMVGMADDPVEAGAQCRELDTLPVNGFAYRVINIEKRQEQMLGPDIAMAAPSRFVSGGCQNSLNIDSEAAHERGRSAQKPYRPERLPPPWHAPAR